MEHGPTVTVVRFKPDTYTAVSKLKARERDIAFYLRSPTVRITYDNRTGLICLEVPNLERGRVSLASLLASPRSNEPLMIPAGVSVTNTPVWYSLATMPHLLVAGATGSGKSVFLNAVIASLAAQYTPAEVQLILVDPKRVEFNVFEGLPHLGYGKVIYDSDETVQMLTDLEQLMRDRYELLSTHSDRNISEYLLRSGHTLPYVVLIIDELADLFGNSPAAQELIIRLGQLGRAAGIHMVLATQRPSHDIISGRLKANFPARAAFRVSTAIDSRVVMDQSGAELLLGRGDAIIKVPGFDDQRVTACFVDHSEVKPVVDWWQAQGTFPEASLFAEKLVPEQPKVDIFVSLESIIRLPNHLQERMLGLEERGVIKIT
jgi:S-DNA-T family DNA segregation ATPase FtsK/SpoIIIE